MNLHLALLLLSVACAAALSIGGSAGFDGRDLYANGRLGFGGFGPHRSFRHRPLFGPPGRGPPWHRPPGYGPPGLRPPWYRPPPPRPTSTSTTTSSSTTSSTTSSSTSTTTSSTTTSTNATVSNQTNANSGNQTGRRRRSIYGGFEDGITRPLMDKTYSQVASSMKNEIPPSTNCTTTSSATTYGHVTSTVCSYVTVANQTNERNGNHTGRRRRTIHRGFNGGSKRRLRNKILSQVASSMNNKIPPSANCTTTSFTTAYGKVISTVCSYVTAANQTNANSGNQTGRRRRSIYGEFEAGIIKPSIDKIFSQGVNNSGNAPNVSNIPSLSNTSAMPNIPGLRDAIEEARERVQTSLGLGNNMAEGIQQSVESALRSNDPRGSLSALLSTILSAYATVAQNCPLIIVGTRVMQEGVRLATEVARSARNVMLGSPAADLDVAVPV